MSQPEPVIVLVEPQLGENIGAALRAMCNFGLQKLRLVRPRDAWPNPAAVALATGASHLLSTTQLYDTTEAAVSDCAAIYATTARPRGLTKRVLTPEQAMCEIRAQGRRVALLFGPERSGLCNADIILSNTIISVPVDPAFPSLNLAQCVLLVAYEWRRSGGTSEKDGRDGEATELASVGTVSRFLKHLTEELDTAGCFFADHKREAMSASLENLFRRAPLTDQDVRTLWRVVRSLSEKRERRG